MECYAKREDGLMKIDVTELMNHRSSKITFDYTFDPDHTDAECVDLPDDVKIAENGIRVVGSAEDSLGCMNFTAHVRSVTKLYAHVVWTRLMRFLNSISTV